jgi:probable F420-dependent oxidoreductase
VSLKVDLGSVGNEGVDIRERAQHAQSVGYDTLWMAETKHDPFLPLVTAAEHTDRIRLGTNIALAFARNPMTVAATANDLQQFSEGRFLLGLGSQIQAHITRRFSMPWSRPAARMREFVLALHAIWDAWNHETKLDFRGEFYTHTLMTPFFAPEPNPYGPPKVWVAGIGERMSQVVGEVGDGLLCHSLTTAKYLSEVILPNVRAGQAKAGRSGDGFETRAQLIVVTGRDDAEIAQASATARQSLAFYLSTPAYRGVLEVHGWEARQDELTRLSKQGEWEAMAKLVDDEMLDTFAVIGPPAEIPARLEARFGGLLDRVSFSPDLGVDPELFDDIAREMLAA